MSEQATILIPDISGYTAFVARTEIDHSTHILNSLLESIIKSIDESFVVSEIEGDAVLLYRKGDPPSQKEIIDQCVKTFRAFHENISMLCATKLCQCGACQGTSDLTLKFVVHYGPIAETNVSRFVKASGVDMVIAHRLLKNAIPEHEYVLVTNNYFRNVSGSYENHSLTWNESKEEYPSIGVVEFRFASLAPIKAMLPAAHEAPPAFIPVDKAQYEQSEIEINASHIYVHSCMLDFNRRNHFASPHKGGEGPDVLIMGAKHTCIFEEASFVIEPRYVSSTDDEIIYEEFFSSPDSGIFALSHFRFQSLGEHRCRVTSTVSPQPGHTLPPAVLTVLKEQFGKSGVKMKEYCEKMYPE